ncbi:MAG TPA: hypothetical protein VG297_22495, partial [Bryobacteraceae bacterium]|nr:hypothetical protein [Bryobacteraceae bacterium]
MWLLDANLDVHLVELLKAHSINSNTAENRGWKALRNGELIAAAVDAGFDALLTRDHLFAESAARIWRLQPKFAIVVVDIPNYHPNGILRHFAKGGQRSRLSQFQDNRELALNAGALAIRVQRRLELLAVRGRFHCFRLRFHFGRFIEQEVQGLLRLDVRGNAADCAIIGQLLAHRRNGLAVLLRDPLDLTIDLVIGDPDRLPLRNLAENQRR